jgi:hypothetical protein
VESSRSLLPLLCRSGERVRPGRPRRTARRVGRRRRKCVPRILPARTASCSVGSAAITFGTMGLSTSCVSRRRDRARASDLSFPPF